MAGISTGSGIFSGIDSQSLISQLLAIEARPKLLAQRRILQLQTQQSSYLDINSRLNALKSAAAGFRTGRTFNSMLATSSDSGVLSATASTSATPGTYSFLVDRLVSSQQLLSRGFTDRDTTGLGASSFSFESAAARLDRDTALADLNGGEGIDRGRITITQGTTTTEVDLSRAATVNDVLDAINGATGLGVTASVRGGKFVVRADSGTITIQNAAGSTTAESLGIAAAVATAEVVGTEVHALSASTSLAALNDGNGVAIANQGGTGGYDFTIAIAGQATPIQVNIGDVWENVVPPGGGAAVLTRTQSAVSTIDGALDRINAALTAGGVVDVSASVNSATGGLAITDASGAGRAITVAEHGRTTAADLGLLGTSATGALQGSRVLAGLNSTLASGLNGGAGVGGDGAISITGRDGLSYSVSVDTTSSLSDMLAEFSADTAGMFTAALNDRGTGIVVTDRTGSTAGNLIIAGATAESLGIDTAPGGVASGAVDSGNLQHQYVTASTLLSSLNGGRGIGTGTFRITDSVGATSVVDIGSDARTVDDIMREINSRGTRVQARLNANGDGVELFEQVPAGGVAGGLKIKVSDETGAVAKALNVAGEAESAGAGNVIDGSFERTVEFAATDTLDDIVEKINEAGVGAAASIINDGSGGTPFRLSIASTVTGSQGRFIVDAGDLDLDLETLDLGENARVFFGSDDPARAVLLTSSTNSLDNVVQGVSIDLRAAGDDPVTLTVAADAEGIEGAVDAFLEAFNGTIERINFQSRYDDETKARGPLIGDSTTLSLRTALYSTIQKRSVGASGSFDRLVDVGVSIGEGGKLTLDRDRFREALAQDPESVAALFASRTLAPDEPIDLGGGVTVRDPDREDEFTELGVVGQIEEIAKKFLDSTSGPLSTRKKALDDQIQLQTRRIEQFDIRLATRRGVLERQFLAMEQAIAQLQSQQGAISSIGALVG